MSDATLVVPAFVGADFKNEWIEGLSNEAYHADRAAVSSSGLAEQFYQHSPLEYFYRSIQGHKRNTTDDMKFGTMVHEAILEPDLFKTNYAVMPSFNQGTTLGKARAQAWREENEGKHILTEDQSSALLGIAANVLKDPWVKRMLDGAAREISGYSRDPVSGLKVRIRPDALQKLANGKRILLDLKTTRDGSYQGFFGEIKKYAYDMRMAMYEQGVKEIDGAPPDSTIVLAVEKVPPYHYAIYEIDESILATGNHIYRVVMQRLAQCIRTNNWPSYQVGPQKMLAPKWYQDQMAQKIDELESHINTGAAK